MEDKKRGHALERFLRYRAMALLLESAKEAPRNVRDEAVRAVSWCDAALDEAWEEVGVIHETLDDEDAEIVASHYLFLEDWRELGARHGYAMDKVKKVAYRALEWLDAYERGDCIED